MCKTLVRDLKAAEWYTVRARTNHFTLSCWFSVSWFEGRESEGSRDGEKRKEMLEDCVIHSPPCWALIRELTYAKLSFPASYTSQSQFSSAMGGTYGRFEGSRREMPGYFCLFLFQRHLDHVCLSLAICHGALCTAAPPYTPSSHSGSSPPGPGRAVLSLGPCS